MQQDDSSDKISISDIIAVIEENDPEVKDMFNPNSTIDGGILQPQNVGGRQTQQQQQQPPPNNNNPTNAYVEIIEQPTKALRFRYKSEGRLAGSILGESSTPENKTYPAIRIRNYTGWAEVVVSCVTKDHPYRPHPHELVGKEGCKNDGVCTMKINNEAMSLTFSNLGIQCAKKNDIVKNLLLREAKGVDPFRTGFSHRNQPANIDQTAVRLCFQAFIRGPQSRISIPLPPVVSNPIYDTKGATELVICKMGECSADVRGGREIMLLCGKVAKENIQVRFYEVDCNNDVTWEAFGDFNPTNVHRRVAITFKVPAYHDLNIEKPVFVFVQLKRPSDDACSEPLQFEYIPQGPDNRLKKSSKRFLNYESIRELQQAKQLKQENTLRMSSLIPLSQTGAGFFNHTSIVHEHEGRLPYQLTPYRVPQESPSPQPSPTTPLTPPYCNFGSSTYIPLRNPPLNTEIQSQTNASYTCGTYNNAELNENGELSPMTKSTGNWYIPTAPYNFDQNQNIINTKNHTESVSKQWRHANETNDHMNISDNFSSSQLLLSTLQTLPNFNSILNPRNTEYDGQTFLMNGQARMEQDYENMSDSFISQPSTETVQGIGYLNQYTASK